MCESCVEIFPDTALKEMKSCSTILTSHCWSTRQTVFIHSFLFTVYACASSVNSPRSENCFLFAATFPLVYSYPPLILNNDSPFLSSWFKTSEKACSFPYYKRIGSDFPIIGWKFHPLMKNKVFLWMKSATEFTLRLFGNSNFKEFFPIHLSISFSKCWKIESESVRKPLVNHSILPT